MIRSTFIYLIDWYYSKALQSCLETSSILDNITHIYSRCPNYAIKSNRRIYIKYKRFFILLRFLLTIVLKRALTNTKHIISYKLLNIKKRCKLPFKTYNESLFISSSIDFIASLNVIIILDGLVESIDNRQALPICLATSSTEFGFVRNPFTPSFIKHADPATLEITQLQQPSNASLVTAQKGSITLGSTKTSAL